MSNLIPHVFNTITVRSLERDGQIWFVAADVCKALEINNPSQALTRLDSDEKTTLTNNEGRAGQGAQNYNIINESGLYSLILRSRKTEAKQFKKWVTSEVLPSIRKTGSYSLTLNKRQQYLIRQAVLDNVAETANTFHSVYKKLYTRFNVYRYQDILAKDFDEAIELLGGVVNPIDNLPVLPNINQKLRWLLVVRNNQIAEVKSLKDYICVNKYRCI